MKKKKFNPHYKPWHPTKPPEKIISQKKIGDSLKWYGTDIPLADFLAAMPKDATHVSMHPTCDSYSTDISIIFTKHEEIPNPTYEKLMKRYEKDYKEYKEQLVEWNRQKEEHEKQQEEAERKTYEKLKKKFESA